MSEKDDSLPVPDREKIDRLADQFEREFKDGEKPRIEDYLDRQPELRQHLLKELIALELELRRAAGDRPQVTEYRERFPDDSVAIDDLFAEAPPQPLSVDSTLDKRPESIDTEAEDDPVPEQLGRYQIQRVLGKGGFGVVYLAHDPQLDRPVALKVPRRKRFKTQEEVSDFIKEAKTAAKLRHLGVVAVQDVQKDETCELTIRRRRVRKRGSDYGRRSDSMDHSARRRGRSSGSSHLGTLLRPDGPLGPEKPRGSAAASRR